VSPLGEWENCWVYTQAMTTRMKTEQFISQKQPRRENLLLHNETRTKPKGGFWGVGEWRGMELY